jgi:hypothetical protein
VTCSLCSNTGLTKWEIEINRGNEILMRVFFAVSEQDATQQARRGYPEYRVTECRRVET